MHSFHRTSMLEISVDLATEREPARKEPTMIGGVAARSQGRNRGQTYSMSNVCLFPAIWLLPLLYPHISSGDSGLEVIFIGNPQLAHGISPSSHTPPCFDQSDPILHLSLQLQRIKRSYQPSTYFTLLTGAEAGR